MQTYFLYRHIRLDKNEVFYVGIGTKRPNAKFYRTIYLRAFSNKKYHRSNLWNKIVGKTDYEVEIIFESNNLNLILNKEKEFIKLYGRKDLKTGTLSNLCEGGTMNGLGYKLTEDQKKNKQKHFYKNNYASSEVFVYKSTGEFVSKFSSHKQAEKTLNLFKHAVGFCLRGILKHAKQYVFFKEFKGEFIGMQNITGKRSKKIGCYDKELNLIESFDTVTIAAKSVNGFTSNICKSAKLFGQQMSAGYFWKFLE